MSRRLPISVTIVILLCVSLGASAREGTSGGGPFAAFMNSLSRGPSMVFSIPMIQVQGQPLYADKFCVDGEFLKAPGETVQVCKTGTIKDREGYRNCDWQDLPAIVSRYKVRSTCKKSMNGDCLEWQDLMVERPRTYTIKAFEVPTNSEATDRILRHQMDFTLPECL
ncbi:MAG: hypothetical protein H6624_01435 [Bdellovibrionaceae bacterium]|nr:hypothetical protein [Bdellovibrionales bacterium]MCB9082970.1 hypothetical protein [Pseudobdellovibrionaceae bacterium]